ncbi:uncharacterized protein LOC120645259 [Panicum virgatum]|uniref:Uncharacterized protein n=1 Tax=Panicum virgatum TaxID=38727 RepID=A0A8T0PR48_PANVG|nr:uncharacterized protein LOC120645259 [Panicum virgatum]KAG2564150.1 hypothetical protein PVAP13_8KG388760 [Panicum virgatum]
MAAKLRSPTATCNTATVVLTIVTITVLLLVSTGHARGTLAVAPPPPEEDDPPPCRGYFADLEECAKWCNEQGFYGGGFIHLLCCCGSRIEPRLQTPPPRPATIFL